MIKQISSTQNTFIKYLLTLKEKSRNRKKEQSFVLEGQRELLLAKNAGYHIKTICYQPNLVGNDFLSQFSDESVEFIGISTDVFQKLAHRSTTEGIIAEVSSKSHELKDLKLSEKPLVLVMEAPEKPGNIGAMLRTADAANIDAVLIANPKTDLYNPNIIRSSVGCVFTNQIAMGSTQEIIEFLKKNQIAIYCAALQNSNSYHLEDYKKSSALVVGTEDVGLSEEWLSQSHQNIIIPMSGAIDSMNVSVAAGILLFEAKRQRGF